MKDIKIRQGASFEDTLVDSDITAASAVITISTEDGTIVKTDTAGFVVDGDKTLATISFIVDLPIGEYEYMYTITYADGFISKMPEPSDCGDGDCELPKLIVCDANDVGGS